ncbi:MAG: TonB-dependent receptor [Pseudomonadota bacterium]|nr:TonB-dependent receptor [Pseudomonadota bacterium]
MKFQHTLLAAAVLSTFSSIVSAQEIDATTPKIIVTASPFKNADSDQILNPAKVLAGDELRDKIGSSLGETLSQELGVSASAFGAGASRPIIRGMEGARVKMLENGMSTSDVSGLSNDHAVAAEGAVAQQIEILRGPAALLYGSGAIGGLVNVVNERIPTALEKQTTGTVETRYSTVDQGKNASGTVDTAVGQFALHIDGNIRNTDNYKIPGDRILNGNNTDPDSVSGRLPNSTTKERTWGLGSSYIADWGYIGASASRLTNLYGIPSLEGSKINQAQTKYDIDSLVNKPFDGFDSFKFKMGYSDYNHAELDQDNQPAVLFNNRSLETRAELTHSPIAALGNVRGTFGIQTDNNNFSALSPTGGADTVPVTHSTSQAAFLVEEVKLGAVALSAGGRVESVKRKPVSNIERSFSLKSGSVGGLWAFTPGYATGLTFSYAERAPATEELYSGGPHDATETFDIGNPNFKIESSKNVELSLEKTTGLIHWKANAFLNKVDNYIFGNVTGTLVDDEGNVVPTGGTLRQRIFEQAAATVHGVEAELTYNALGKGWNGRVFGDMSRGRLDDAGSLPLQPANRIGASVGYKVDAWRAGMSLVHGQGQDRLASFESTTTPAYNDLGANISYTQKLAKQDVTYFLLAKNLLNDDIRLSTSLLKDVAPLPGRNFVFGVRTHF